MQPLKPLFYIQMPVESLRAEFAEQEGEFLLGMAGHDISTLQLFVDHNVFRLRDKPLIDLEATNRPFSMVRLKPTARIVATASAKGTRAMVRYFDF
jgi:hypothetical protein